MRASIAVRVHSVVEVTPRMVEVRLQGRTLSAQRFGAASHVVVRVPVSGGTVRRVYSVWTADRLAGVVRLRIDLHGADTPGCAWATSARAGDEVVIEPPRTKIALDPQARYHLFAGEETGAVPLLALRAALFRSPAARGGALGVLEAPGPVSEMPGAPGVPPLPWVHRGEASAVGSRVLVDAVRGLLLPDQAGVAYLAGESETCRLLQHHLVTERGWPRSAVKVQPQWAAGRPGFGAGRD